MSPGFAAGAPSASSSGRRAKSSRSVSSIRGVYSAAAGWKIGYSRTARLPSVSTSGRPCTRVIPVGSSRSSLVEKLPSVQITLGWISSTWRYRYPLQFSISAGCGSRLPGGLHLSTLR